MSSTSLDTRNSEIRYTMALGGGCIPPRVVTGGRCGGTQSNFGLVTAQVGNVLDGGTLTTFTSIPPHALHDAGANPDFRVTEAFLRYEIYFRPAWETGIPNVATAQLVNVTFTATPEPATVALTGVGVLALGAWAHRRRQA